MKFVSLSRDDNPENVEQVITKAFVNLNELEKAGYKFRGANGKYTQKEMAEQPEAVCNIL